MKTHRDPASGCRFPGAPRPSSFSETHLEAHDDGTCPECGHEVEVTKLGSGAVLVECLGCSWETERDGL